MSKHATPSTQNDLEDLTRRDFIKTTLAGFAAASSASVAFGAAQTASDGTPDAESLAVRLAGGLSAAQRRAVVLPYDDPRRLVVAPNWRINDQRIDKLFNGRQQAMIRSIFLRLHGPAYAQAALDQVERDNGNGGLGSCSVALFGSPRTPDRFEFVLTGRHVTRRCGAEAGAWAGPVFLGGPQSPFAAAADRAGQLFGTLGAVRARSQDGSSLSAGEMGIVRDALAQMLQPLRAQDVQNTLKRFDACRADDNRLTVIDGTMRPGWLIQGPRMTWDLSIRPHAHTWLHIREEA